MALSLTGPILVNNVSSLLGGGSGGGGTPAIPLLSSIDADGWYGVWNTSGDTIPSEFDPHSSPQTITVSRPGFNSSGTATTVSKTLTLMKRVRQPYPSQSTLTTGDVALDDYIYSTDSITGVTNNSLLAPPRPIAAWAQPDRIIVDDGSLTVKLFVAHAYAQQGRPVAAVVFSVTDGTNTVTSTVTSLTTTSYTASGKSVPYYEATIDISSLDAGAVTLDAEIRPWEGAAFSASDRGSNLIRFSQQTVINNKSLTRPRVYAYVDGGGGSGAAVSTSEATALTTPYDTLADAATAIRAYNNTNHSSNFGDYGVIIVKAGLDQDTKVATGVLRTTCPTSVAPLTIRAETPASKSTTIVTTPANDSDALPTYLVLEDVRLDIPNASRQYSWCNGGDAARQLALIRCEIDEPTGVYEDTVFAQTGRLYVQDCDFGTAKTSGRGIFSRFSTNLQQTNLIGSNLPGAGSATVYNAIGCSSANIDGTTAGSAEAKQGICYAYNSFGIGTGTGRLVNFEHDAGVDGAAIVGNQLEGFGTYSDALIWINADSNNTATQNIVAMLNTIVGERPNWLYAEGTSTKTKSFFRYNLTQEFNIKGDVFGTDGTYIGNWSQRYRVGHRYNTNLLSTLDAQAGTSYGASTWAGEVRPLGESDVTTKGSAIDPDFADDQSNDGGDAGSGDYTPDNTSNYDGALIPSGEAPYSIDQFGTALANDGTDFVGAVQ